MFRKAMIKLENDGCRLMTITRKDLNIDTNEIKMYICPKYPKLWYLLVHRSGVPEFTPGFYWGSCYSIFSFMCMFCRCCLSFFFDHCVVCPSIYGFYLPLWYLQTHLNVYWITPIFSYYLVRSTPKLQQQIKIKYFFIHI
jgi:hypothetical protein